MPDAKEFLDLFMHEKGLMQVCPRHPGNALYYSTPPDLTDDLHQTDLYFAPALRKNKGPNKENVLGTWALWVDCDAPAEPQCTIPPSLKVWSGHGWHLYWLLSEFLDSPSRIEQLNQALIADIPTADEACWNCNRVLRVPGTTNTKEPEAHEKVRLVEWGARRYLADDVQVLGRLSPKTRDRIHTGTLGGVKTRSERDWAVVMDLVRAGASDDLVRLVFDAHPVGDKARGEKPDYLTHTLEKARGEAKAAPQRKKGPRGEGGVNIEQRDDGYYTLGQSVNRVSTFVIQPKILLDGGPFDTEDAIVGDVIASGYTWPDITFPKQAFSSVARMDKELPKASWQWLGKDSSVRLLLPYLLDKLQKEGLPKIAASPVMGLHKVRDRWLFLGDKHTLASDAIWQGNEGPLTWLPTKKEHPKLSLVGGVTKADLDLLAELPNLNEPGVMWTLIGWFAAATVKPWLESIGVRFPIMNVTGTKGSGKTTILQRVMMPLFGQVEPKPYSSATTHFVRLALLGGTNAIPIAFSEYRADGRERFEELLRNAYDTGSDPRGRSDQTTVDYKLSAPVCVDGEDLIGDAAARERLVVARLRPDTTAEGSPAYDTYSRIRRRIPAGFAGHFVQQVLGMLERGELDSMLESARDAVFEAFPARLPDRVRNNYTVVHFGVLMWCKVTGMDVPSPKLYEQGIAEVCNLESGRTRSQVDEFVEAIVNFAATNSGGNGDSQFPWRCKGGEFRFQFGPAHDWWVTHRRRQGKASLERDAIRSQLLESVYGLKGEMLEGAWMLGVDLRVAQETGLDVINKITSMVFRINLGDGLN